MSFSNSERNTQLTSVADYDVNRMIFSEPQYGSVSGTPISFKRIHISTLNPDGSVGDLILPTERLFSFGVSENRNPQTQQVNGHVLPLCLYNREGATEKEKQWVETFNRIVEHCKDHLVQNREEIEQYDLTKSDLKKFNPLYWKREKGKIVEGTGPTLYAKLIESRKHNKIISMFFDENGNPLDPKDLAGKYCYVQAAVKIESIFIGNKISLQVKLYEARVELLQRAMKPLLSRPKPKGLILQSTNSTNKSVDTESEDDIDVDDSSEEEEEEEKPKKAQKVTRVRRRGRGKE